ncbi:hypothetical protein [Mesorhizobium sp. M0571]
MALFGTAITNKPHRLTGVTGNGANDVLADSGKGRRRDAAANAVYRRQI